MRTIEELLQIPESEWTLDESQRMREYENVMYSYTSYAQLEMN